MNLLSALEGLLNHHHPQPQAQPTPQPQGHTAGDTYNVYKQGIPMNNLNGSFENQPVGTSVVSDAGPGVRYQAPRYFPFGYGDQYSQSIHTVYPLLPINPAAVPSPLPQLEHKGLY